MITAHDHYNSAFFDGRTPEEALRYLQGMHDLCAAKLKFRELTKQANAAEAKVRMLEQKYGPCII